MRLCLPLVVLVLSSLSAAASELTVRVVDPDSRPVAGAEIELFLRDSTRIQETQSTSAQGLARFRRLADQPIRLKVLAPGFAEAQEETSPGAPGRAITVRLRLASADQTVVVTATRTPVSIEQSGATIDSVSGAELDTLLPISASDALRLLPGAIVSTAGERGGLSSLFVRGGDSRYNKVIVDGVPVNEPGGTFDFGTLSLSEADRLEFLRGAESTLYGSDAMTSVVQVWSRTGNSPRPELRLSSDAGNYGTESGAGSLSGARGRFDFNAFASQFDSQGSGPNDDYSNSLEGLNAGAKLEDRVSLRLRTRHDNAVNGVQGEWNFNGHSLLQPDHDQRARLNNVLGSLELTVTAPSGWSHRLVGFDYTQHRTNLDGIEESGRFDPNFQANIDTPFHTIDNVNRAGLDYQANYAERSWALTTLGYEFEDEHGTVGDLLSDTLSAGLRRNQAAFAQQIFTFRRASLVAGGRVVDNESFGNRFVPASTLTLLALRGGRVFSGTRLIFQYAEGIKEPSFAESFGNGGSFPTLPNLQLKPEETRALGGGFEQNLGASYAFSAQYFNNLFRNKIDFNLFPCFCKGQYVNVNEAMAHGAELTFKGRPLSRLSFALGYAYTSTQILKQPFAFDPLLTPGRPLLRRPRHSASLLATFLGSRWGADLGASFVGARPDSDFLGFGFSHTPGYVLVTAGGWYKLSSRITVYAHGENLLDRFYEEVIGYPALGANFRAGMRFRIGGE